MKKLILFQGESNSGKSTTLRQLILDLEKEVSENKVVGEIIPLDEETINHTLEQKYQRKFKHPKNVLLFNGSKAENLTCTDKRDWGAIIRIRHCVVIITTGGDTGNYLNFFKDLLDFFVSQFAEKGVIVVGVLAVSNAVMGTQTGSKKLEEIKAVFVAGTETILFSSKIHLRCGPVPTTVKVKINEQRASDLVKLEAEIFSNAPLGHK